MKCPRPYPFQVEDLDRMDELNGRVLLAWDLGLGKSSEAIRWIKRHAKKALPAVVVCPAFLKYQWMEQAHLFGNFRSDILDGTRPAETNGSIPPITIVNPDILGQRRDENSGPGQLRYLLQLKPKTIVVDECFPPETKITTSKGLMAIGEIVENKIQVDVACVNNKTGMTEFRKIKHHFKLNRNNNLVTVIHENGALVCTEDHKVWTAERGYVEAAKLLRGDSLQTVSKEIRSAKSKSKKILLDKLLQEDPKKGKAEKDLPGVQTRIPRLTVRSAKILFSEMFHKLASASTRIHEPLHERNAGKSSGVATSLLENHKERGKNQEVIFKQNEEEESDAEPKNSPSDDADKKQKGQSPCLERPKRRQRKDNSTTTKTTQTAATNKSEMGTGDTHSDQKEAPKISTQIHSRYREHKFACSHRSRWRWSPFPKEKTTGQKKDQNASISRVVGIKIHKQNDRQKPCEGSPICPYVYCLEIEQNHNFFADSILVSNCQLYASRTSKRTGWLRELCNTAPFVLALSATPLTSKPADLFPILNILRPDKWQSFPRFASKHCNPTTEYGRLVYKGASNIPKLNRRLLRHCLIRRRKEDVLSELPKLTHEVVPLPISSIRKYAKARDNFLAWLAEEHPERVHRAMWMQRLVQFGYLLRYAAKLKLRAAVQWIDSFLANTDEKLSLFATHRKVIRKLRRRYKQSVVVDGSTAMRTRRDCVRRFQTDDKCRLFIGNIKAAGTGLDGLQHACSNGAFIELPWVPADVSQVVGRLDRLGQTKPVVFSFLVARETIEESLCGILRKKSRLLAAVLDGDEEKADLESVFRELEKEITK